MSDDNYRLCRRTISLEGHPLKVARVHLPRDQRSLDQLELRRTLVRTVPRI